MREIDKLAVEVGRDSITITQPQTGEQITYNKNPVAPLLVAQELLQQRLETPSALFLAQAWGAAYETARSVGWLRS